MFPRALLVRGLNPRHIHFAQRAFSASRFIPGSYPLPSAAERSSSPWTTLLGFVIVPQQKAYVIERFGKFSTVLEAGLYPLIPLVERVAYVHSLKETALSIPSQSAITKDNVTISLDGVLYVSREGSRAVAAPPPPLYSVSLLFDLMPAGPCIPLPLPLQLLFFSLPC
jgi:hypothetical protein